MLLRVLCAAAFEMHNCTAFQIPFVVSGKTFILTVTCARARVCVFLISILCKIHVLKREMSAKCTLLRREK